MASSTQTSPSQQLRDWLRRHDWTLYEAATEAIETRDAFVEGLGAVNKRQLRAVINTARMCSSPSAFRGFLKKRADRRRTAGQDEKADFWRALVDALDDVQEKHATPAVEEVGIPEARADAAEMRVLRTYFEHLISHCHVAGH